MQSDSEDGIKSEALANLTSPELTIEHEGESFAVEAIPGTEQSFKGVFLGDIGRSFRDTVEEPIPEMGIVFGVDQRSYGYTGVAVKSLDGFDVEALKIDEETKLPKWQEPRDRNHSMIVSGDWGNMQKLPIMTPLWKQENMGNAGVRAGVVRVTNKQTGEVRYYGLGAKFRGSPDKWNVERGVIELRVTDKLSAPKPELPGETSEQT